MYPRALIQKKLQTRFGKQSPTHMNISSFAQETMCYMGQHLVFKESEQVINTLTGADVNAKQVERLCHHYGQSLQDNLLYDIEPELCIRIVKRRA